jgi:hypothetical protein
LLNSIAITDLTDLNLIIAINDLIIIIANPDLTHLIIINTSLKSLI